MPVQITIRGVPDEVRDDALQFAAQVALHRLALASGAGGELASNPDVEAWLAEARAIRSSGPKVTADEILRHRHADLR